MEKSDSRSSCFEADEAPAIFRQAMVKRLLKRILLGVGLYYKVNAYRFRHDRRSPSQQAFYAGLINKSDLVFDVGANVGQRSEIFSRLAAQVVAFEPQAECVKHLKSRFMFRRNVEIVQVALSEAEGEALLYESSAHDLSSMSPTFIENFGRKVFKETWDRKVPVQTRTLDQMIDLYGLPRFIKIDVEGWELSVLKGLSQPVPFLSFEFTPLIIDEAKKCVTRLNEVSADYLYDYCLGEKLDFVLPEHVDYETFSRDVLPQLQGAASFGDIYAIMKSDLGGRPS
jgi:FkbM family methyltransferase